MPSGFFHSSTLRSFKPPESRVPKCGACKLLNQCRSSKMAHGGEGRRGILIVGEAPGPHEDAKGRHFVGEDGQLLKRALAKHGIDMRRDCWLTNSIICHPGNKSPTEDQVNYCRPNLLNLIKELNPTVIIPLGASAVRSIMGSIWNDTNIGNINKWVGWTIPYQNWNTWICPTFHPSYVTRNLKMRFPDKVPELFFNKHLEKAVQFEDRPWDTVPDYVGEIESIVNTRDAIQAIKEIYQTKGDIAFDYEANMLKPDNDRFLVYSCSICINGERTIAYPWNKKTAAATRKLLRAKHGKIASNLKYEDRVTRKVLRTPVRNWKWDTMLAAHTMNNQPGVTSVKFQSFVLLGFPPYNEHIEPLLRTDSNRGYSINNIEEISMKDLLVYNGVDSLVEYLVYLEQRKLFI